MLERHDTLRDNIRYAREQKNLSVKRLAELAGVGDSTIANFESRIAPRMTDRIAHQIARALGVTLEDLQDPGFRLRFQPTGTVRPEPTPAQSQGGTALHEKAGHIQEFLRITEGASEDVIDDILAYAKWKAERAAGRKSAAGGVVYGKPQRG